MRNRTLLRIALLAATLVPLRGEAGSYDQSRNLSLRFAEICLHGRQAFQAERGSFSKKWLPDVAGEKYQARLKQLVGQVNTFYDSAESFGAMIPADKQKLNDAAASPNGEKNLAAITTVTQGMSAKGTNIAQQSKTLRYNLHAFGNGDASIKGNGSPQVNEMLGQCVKALQTASDAVEKTELEVKLKLESR